MQLTPPYKEPGFSFGHAVPSSSRPGVRGVQRDGVPCATPIVCVPPKLRSPKSFRVPKIQSHVPILWSDYRVCLRLLSPIESYAYRLHSRKRINGNVIFLFVF